MTTVADTFSEDGVSATLTIGNQPETITYALGGTINGSLTIQRRVGISAWATVIGPVPTSGASGTFKAQAGDVLRASIQGSTSPSATYSIADEDAVIRVFRDNAGTPTMTETEAKFTFHKPVALSDDTLVATAAEINRAADLSTRVVTLVATTAITVADHEGKTCVLADVGGDTLVTLTLPAATASGARFRFVVGVVNTSSYVFKSVVGTDLMEGVIIGASTTDSATDAARTWLSGASDDTVTLNGTTMGGAAIGDWIEFEDISATGWAVRGMVTQSGSEATPFSNTVA